MMLHRLIGLNSDILDRLFVFGIRVMLVLFISARDMLEFRAFKIMLEILLPTTS